MTSTSAKRKRSTSDLKSSPADDKHQAFTTWCHDRGIKTSHVRPTAILGRGIGLLTDNPVKAGAELIIVPKTAMILPRTTLPSDLSPQAQLAATLLGLRHAEDDAYTRCATVWPTAEDFHSSLVWYDRSVPQAWTDASPRSCRVQLRRLLDDRERDREAILKAIEAGDLEAQIDDFEYAWTIANTRSFSFKPEGSKKGSMVICPFLDYMNHCPAGQGCEVSVSDDGYKLVANRAYKKGEEILATYGAHSNDKLLIHYGFSMPDSSDDSVALDEIILPALSAKQKEDLEGEGYLGNYTLDPGTNDICFRTQVALRAKLLTANEWEYYMTAADDIAEDKSGIVVDALQGMIKEYAVTISARQKELKAALDKTDAGADRAVLGALLDRWTQIEKALDLFCS